jgi:hypothetical protein
LECGVISILPVIKYIYANPKINTAYIHSETKIKTRTSLVLKRKFITEILCIVKVNINFRKFGCSFSIRNK